MINEGHQFQTNNIIIDKLCIIFVKNNQNYFKFPFKFTTNQTKENNPVLRYKDNSGITYYEGDLDSFEWYRVIVSTCFWKTQEGVFLKLFKHNDFYINELITNYTNNINYQYSTILESVDKLCDRITEYDSLQKSNFATAIKNASAMKKPNLSYGKTSSDIKITNLSVLKEPPIDETIWYYYKFNTNYIYDMYNTIRVYNALVYNRIYSPNHRISIPDYINYLRDYFYIHAKIKKFNIEFSNKVEDEVIVHYDYYRAIFFNLILFVLNNSMEENKEKYLKIKIYNPQLVKDNDYIIKLDISYIDDKPKIRYNTLANLLKSPCAVHSRQELKKAGLVDIGILVVHYIANMVYDNKLECTTDENNCHFINLTMKATKFTNEKNNHTVVKFKQPKTKISTEHYNKILRNTKTHLRMFRI